jgi:nicotinate-nucleotide adenylyltransferase
LRELACEYPDAQLFLLMGADQAKSLSRWHAIGELTRLAIIRVAERDAAENSSAPAHVHSQDCDPVVQAQFRKIVLAPMPHSATHIRSRVASGHPLNALVCEAVARYIQDNHLYQTAR